MVLARSVRSQIHRERGPNNLAKRSLIPDCVIARVRLKPTCGQGWNPGVGLAAKEGGIRDLRKEEAP